MRKGLSKEKYKEDLEGGNLSRDDVEGLNYLHETR